MSPMSDVKDKKKEKFNDRILTQLEASHDSHELDNKAIMAQRIRKSSKVENLEYLFKIT